jgi:hypothetical protein
VLLIYGADNLGLVRLQRRAKPGLRKRQDDSRLTIIRGLDHSMFAPQIRDNVERQVRAFLFDVLPEIPGSTAVPLVTQQ